MTELPVADRLVPSLLDRLTDDQPHEKKESRDARIATTFNLKLALQRDIEWLFNTTRFASDYNLDAYPEIQTSVINYGIPDLAGLSEKSTVEIEGVLTEAILSFEPRVLPETLFVSAVEHNKPRRSNRLDFQIEGQFWSQPLPQALYLRTEIDLDVQSVQIGKNSQRGSWK